MRARQGLAILVAVLLAAPPPSTAADAKGALTGLVKSTAGSPMGQIDIEFVNMSTGVARTVRTDEAGGLQSSLEPGSYSVEAPGYSIVRGPRTISARAGDTTPLELTLKAQDPVAELPGASSNAGAAATDGGRRAGNIVALALFSGSLAGVTIYAATRRDRERRDREPPPSSPSR